MWSIFQPYHDENKLHSLKCNVVRFVLDQHALLDFYSAISLKQQSEERHVAPLRYIILILSQPVLLFLLNAACLVEKQQILIFFLFSFWFDLNPMFDRTQGKHTNHYTTDVIV